jgi:molybdopterin molybdotransferase
MGDLVITTGGASVGEHDLMQVVLERAGAVVHFHGVTQKPGKPMLFATLSGKPVFGLPGNPRAVMILFWEFVLPFLRAIQGAEDPWLKSDRMPIAHAVRLKGERSEFRAAQVKGGQVTLLADEGSHMLRSLVEADALAYIPADVRQIATGDTVEVHYLPR